MRDFYFFFKVRKFEKKPFKGGEEGVDDGADKFSPPFSYTKQSENIPLHLKKIFLLLQSLLSAGHY